MGGDRPVHQHLGLDDRHDSRLLAERCVAGEGLGVGVDAVPGRGARADVDHRPPFGEARAEAIVLLEPLAEAVEALGDLLAGREGKVLGAGVDLDAGHRAGGLDQVDQRRAVLGLLSDGLVIEDDAGDGGLHRLVGAEQHLAVIAAAVLARLDAEGVEALGDGAAALVGGKDALALRDHALRDVFQCLGHRNPPGMRFDRRLYSAKRRPLPRRGLALLRKLKRPSLKDSLRWSDEIG